ncbi:aldehyde dehydrogenase family protein [Saccharolobus caldissimus]|uniref:Aldehyde dehydrogenase domain-containing protein n=1 Tax=Saccharolobus caldissimus TaxID=1702097 RepID=A0AAQ4CV56_9CREN|nr:aldehyde dehydrogenase family protein [Saccharolobus caldissimus]BDB99687.1 hypothetical protein SACC_27040 [Saccharolobus caldissimus]
MITIIGKEKVDSENKIPATEEVIGYVLSLDREDIRKVIDLFKGKVPERGYHFPSVILRLPPFSVVKEEVFGPILTVILIEEEVVNIANSTQYGLTESIFASNFSRTYEIASKIEANTVIINDTTGLRWDDLSFIRFKKSEMERESIIDTMLEMTKSKLIAYSR